MALLRKFLDKSGERRAVPGHVTDADLVAQLLSAGNFLKTSENEFVPLGNTCTALSDILGSSGTKSDTQLAIANFEKMALYVAGRIRVSPEVKSAGFWLNIYTGHEQRLIFIVALFGALCIVARLSVFLTLTLTRQGEAVQLGTFLAAGLPAVIFHVWGWQGSALLSLLLAWFALCAILAFALIAIGYQERPVHASDRDNDFDSLASSRWPIRLAVAILPAIGFIGTVRGIMLSLNGADAIVWAETVNERSTAISALSADLGLAFATTLLALLGGALLTLLMAFEMALGERMMLHRHLRKD